MSRLSFAAGRESDRAGSVHGVCDRVEAVGEQVSVEVERHRRGLVAEHLLDGLGWAEAPQPTTEQADTLGRLLCTASEATQDIRLDCQHLLRRQRPDV
ncbi:MAG: hypothetical protein ACXVEU_16660, partial [Nocardioidaceae bacterium]